MSRARTFADLATASEAGSLANRNMVMNGDMAICQRPTTNAGITASGYYSCDGWKFLDNSDATITMSQATDLPSGQGFNNSLKIDVTTADSSVGAAQYAIIRQCFEGQFLQRLQKGFSTAKSSTVSFWVKSGLTGTHICRLYDHDNSRQISKSYTIDTADTWEHKTITFAGDTSTGDPLDDDNAQSMTLDFWLLAGSNYTSGSLQTTWADDTAANSAVGQVNVLGNASYNWLITGVQWELGEVATPFAHESFSDNLDRCQRYYYAPVPKGSASSYFAAAWYYSSSLMVGILYHPVEMRANPTVTCTDATNDFQLIAAGVGDYLNDMALNSTNTKVTTLINNSDVSGTAGDTGGLYIIDTTNAELFLSAEL